MADDYDPPAFRLLLPPTLVFLPAVPTALVFATVVLKLPWPIWATAILAGFVGWTFFEYAVHRWIQHAPKRIRWLSIDEHGYHHRQPEDVRELVYPLTWSVTAALVTSGFFCLITWSAVVGLLISAGFWWGYLAYEWIHMSSHVPKWAQDRQWLQRLSRNHYRHHVLRKPANYGFITGFWDRVFRTRWAP